MTTEKRLIDANALAQKLKKHHDFYIEAWGGFDKLTPDTKARVDEISACWAEVYNEPTVDAVEVVRCKDCKHYMAEEKERCEAMRATPYGLCLKHRCFPLAGYHEYRNEDDFCSYGERKDNETG